MKAKEICVCVLSACALISAAIAIALLQSNLPLASMFAILEIVAVSGAIFASFETMKKRTAAALAVLVACCVVSTAAQAQTGSVYGTTEALRQGQASTGVVIHMRQVMVDPSTMKVAATVASTTAIGSLIGNAMVKGNGSAAATVLFGTFGAMAGDRIAKATMSERALEIIVKMDDGRVIPITQHDDVGGIVVGRQVFVITGQNARVVPI